MVGFPSAEACGLGVRPVTFSDAFAGTDTLGYLAGTPVRTFNPQEPGIEASFKTFLQRTPMTNRRPVPRRLVKDTVNALSVYLRTKPKGEPTYFVASYVDKTSIFPMNERERKILRRRYGEALHPQTVCPIFVSPSDADVAALLSTAVGLSRCYFRQSPGRVRRYHELFTLTEVSHCGFLAHGACHSKIRRSLNSSASFRAILEAIGDFEATQAFEMGVAGIRIVIVSSPTCYWQRECSPCSYSTGINAYSTIPAMFLWYGREGVLAGSARFEQARESVVRARRIFQRIRSRRCCGTPCTLAELAASVAAAIKSQILPTSNRSRRDLDPTAMALLAAFPWAVDILNGRIATPFPFPRASTRPAELMTLPGIRFMTAGRDPLGRLGS